MNLSADMGRNLNLRQVVAEQRKERRANIEHSASGAVLLVPPWAIRTTPTNGIGAMVHRAEACQRYVLFISSAVRAVGIAKSTIYRLSKPAIFLHTS